MKTIVLLLSLICTSAFAQGASLVRGDALKRREYQTYSTLSLFVDPTGNDTNACTASGTSACLTVNGALNKLPRFINFPVTLAIAAGTFAENVNITRFTFNGTGSIVTTGATPTAFTVATGTNTGTITAISGTANGGTTGVVTDAAQAWTVNDLRGRFVRFTSGPNTSRQVIVSNTATTVTLAGGYGGTLPVVGNTYVIETNATIISPVTGGALALFSSGNNSAGGGALVSFTNVDFVTTAAGATAATINAAALIIRPIFTECRFITNGASTIGVSLVTGAFSINRSVINATGIALNASQVPTTRIDFAGSYLRGTGGSATGAINFGFAAPVLFFINSWTVESTAGLAFYASSGGLINSGTVTVGAAQQRILCSGATVGLSVFTLHSPAASVSGSSSVVPLSNFGVLKIEGCTTGIQLRGSIRMWTDSLDITGATNSIVLDRGAVLETDATTLTTSTNDVTLDGTVSTLAFVNTLTPKSISNQFGSRFNTDGAAGQLSSVRTLGYIFQFSNLAEASFLAPTAAIKGGFVYGNTAGRPYVTNGVTWDGICTLATGCGATTPAVDSVYINNVTFATTTYGGGVFPAKTLTVSAARFRIRTAGTVGSTNATFRASDGVNNCDCAFACNSAVGNYRAACSGSCAFAASASLTYSMNSIGDCTVGPDIQGNVSVEGLVGP